MNITSATEEASIEALREQYLQLINHHLPEKAKQVSMPVRFNHCFARIVLDNLFEGCWYDHLSRKLPAYKQLDEQQLGRAIAIANNMLYHPETVSQLNQNSLQWRGKRTTG
ncbi:MAG: hypothetical protein WA949_10695 [Phormidesmis sp.]